MSNVPLFVPGLLVALIAAIVVAGRAGGQSGSTRFLAGAIVFAFGLILSATLTPLRGALEVGNVGIGGCDLSRLVPLRPDQLLRLDDSSLNVALFVPLGVVIGCIRDRRMAMLSAVAAVASPFVIEAGQSFVVVLARGCESADVIDNITGLLTGFVVARLAIALASRLPSSRR